MRDRDAEIGRMKRLTKAQAEAAKKKYDERETKLRTSPDDDDIRRGDALNALLTDLADPALTETSWRLAKVELPPDISIKRFGFRFTAKLGDKRSQELSKGVIALGTLDKTGQWPVVLQEEGLKSERDAYEASYRRIQEKCLKGELRTDAVISLKKAIEKLKTKVDVVVQPINGYRASAKQIVGELEKASEMFHANTIDFAQEIIRDTQQHEAHTIGELLAFMRKYRLRFAEAGESPETYALYSRLYDLLREQREKLGLKPGQELTASRTPSDATVFEGMHYKVFENQLSWHKARAKCEELGGRLAIIRNERENRFITSLREVQREFGIQDRYDRAVPDSATGSSAKTCLM